MKSNTAKAAAASVVRELVKTSMTVGDLHNLHLALNSIDTEKTDVAWPARLAFAINLNALQPITASYEKERLALRSKFIGPLETKIKAELDRLKAIKTTAANGAANVTPIAGGKDASDPELEAAARRPFAAEFETAAIAFNDADTTRREAVVDVDLRQVSLDDLNGEKNKHITGGLINLLKPMLSDFG